MIFEKLLSKKSKVNLFFAENEIEELKKCSLCIEQLHDPRFLPCGDTVCHQCIIMKANKDTNEIECCPLCSQVHLVPVNENGFSVNKLAVRLLAKKAEEIHRGDGVKELKSIIKSFKSKEKSFKSKLEHPQTVIREYCDEIRQEIQIKTEKSSN